MDNPEYTKTPDEAILHQDVPEAVKQLSQAGLNIIVISNQACVAKEIISMDQANEIFKKIITEAESAGGKILDYTFCPHSDQDCCSCRKPEPGLFLEMAKKHGLDLSETVFVGDGYRDYLAAEKLNIPFYLVNQGWGPKTAARLKSEKKPFRQVDNLQAAVDLILKSSL